MRGLWEHRQLPAFTLRVLPVFAHWLRETEWVGAIEQVDENRELERLVLLMLVGDGSTALRLADNAALHAALAGADPSGALTSVIPPLGHRPDPMVGRRITGLDRALHQLADAGILVPTRGARWRPSPHAETLAHFDLAALPPATRDAVRDLARRWRRMMHREAERRGEPLSADGAA